MRLLITGGCGFLGSNLSAEAVRRQVDLVVLDDLSRIGSAENLRWLRSLGDFRFVEADVRNAEAVERVVADLKPELAFHLAGQVAMTASLVDPRRDFEVNASGTLNVLEALRRHSPGSGLIYSSTNKVYGDLEQFSYSETPFRYLCDDRPDGFDEETPFECRTPYGCSKGAADQYVRDYARTWGLKTLVLRHSSMYGGRQYATEDQGWIGWFCAEALRVRREGGGSLRISGTGKQVRDVLHAEDVVRLYFRAAECLPDLSGQVLNIGGGMANSLSLLELFLLIGDLEGAEVAFETGPARQSDQRVFVADIRRARRLVGWDPRVDARSGIAAMLDWCRSMPAE
jgi:CDP-paratose 2-epimerase